jgi:hypothetical protein
MQGMWTMQQEQYSSDMQGMWTMQQEQHSSDMQGMWTMYNLGVGMLYHV